LRDEGLRVMKCVVAVGDCNECHYRTLLRINSPRATLTRLGCASSPAVQPSQRMNVGKQIIDRSVIRQNFGHQRHLCAVEVLWMGAANTLLEVMQDRKSTRLNSS